jgi:hypothetical protein
MAFPDREFVDADHLGSRFPGSAKLLTHVLFFQLLDGFPVKTELFSNVLDRRGAAALADIKGKAFGIERVVCEEAKLFLLHFPAPLALDTPDLQIKVDTGVAAGKIADSFDLAVIE